MTMRGPRRAVFFDRDGTLIHDVGYIADPHKVVLTPYAAAAVRLVNTAGWLAMVVTNQSGIARGIVTPDDYDAVRARLDALLAAEGAHLDATRHCPHHPELGAPCACRKPGTLLFEQLVRDFGVDATRSVAIGDRWRDLAPLIALGGRGILVRGEGTTSDDEDRARVAATLAPSLIDAVRSVIGAPSTQSPQSPPSP